METAAVRDGYRRARRGGAAVRAASWTAAVLAAVLVVSGLSAYGYYWRLQSAVEREDVDGLIGGNRPKKLNDALNILVIGSDERSGANARYGRGLRNKAPASDTMVLLHLSPGGRQAMAISWPRDLMLPIPACRRKDGTTVPGSAVAMLNSAIGRAGPACTVNTIERASRIKIDHFVQVDFTGFKDIATAVGGVPVCVTGDVYDKDSGLSLPAGRHRLKGEQALAYVRSRKGFGDGSDTARIKRQQRFFGAMANEALSRGVLTDPKRLNALLGATAKSLTTDRRLSVARMARIAQGMRGLDAGRIRFVTVPTGPYAPDRNRVALVRPAADRFFAAVRGDVTPPMAPARTAAGRVKVFNGSGVDGRAAQVAADLRDRGWRVAGVGNLGRITPVTSVRYGAGAGAQAAALAGLLPGIRTAPRAQEEPGVVDLVIGTRFPGLRPAGGIPVQRGESRAGGAVCERVGK
ncbi:LCP family protein [Spirillospora albida]|uniref:LCP family protein n=1 Tax=Spirillospora albida TaxID=58123 RepID=UPI0004BF2388|nr:LCP family protein [Spirillospora albida]